ncbi:MAG: hypothetical protein EOO90_05225 [Pedobacter sp.]|nr:MAG: hypothetical protein EOO90_05225 [Pedobacter sp.]
MVVENKDAILALIKYSSKERLEQLQKGKMYFNTLKFFEGCDDSFGVGDRFERVYKQTKGKGAVIDLIKEFGNISIQMIKQPDGTHISTYRKDDLYINIFCLYSVSSEENFVSLRQNLPLDMKGFGTHMLIIYNVTEFIKRVKARLSSLGLNPHLSPVKYIDVQEHEGSISYFEKPLKYSYQKEFRIGIQTKVEQSMTIDIGSIKDISDIVSVEKCKAIIVRVGKEAGIDHLTGLYKKLLDNHANAIVAFNNYLKTCPNWVGIDTNILKKLQGDFDQAVRYLKEFEEKHGLEEYRKKLFNKLTK